MKIRWAGKSRRYQTLSKSLFSLIVIFFLTINLIPIIFVKVPLKNMGNQKFDVIIVLGYPAIEDGKPSLMMKQRVIKGVELFKERHAGNMIFTGGAAHNHYIEATVMAKLANSMGVPDSRIVQETKAQNTYQNAFYAVKLMQQKHWDSAIVVTSPNHIERASYLFSQYPIDYAVASSGYPENMSLIEQVAFDQAEKYKLTRLVIFGYSR